MSYYKNSSYPPPGGSSGQGQHAGSGYYGAGAQANQWQQPSQQQQQQQQAAAPTPQYSQWQPNQSQQQQQQTQQSVAAAPLSAGWDPAQQLQQHANAGAGQQQQPGGNSNLFGDPSNMAAMASMAATALATNQFPTQPFTKMTTSFLQDSWARMVPGLETTLMTLRAYFAVDNNYVLQKIKCILFPFLKKEWDRKPKRYGGPDGATPFYDLPTADDNAPDLYLPFMSLITYVLLCALVYGNAGKFNPEVIPDVTTKCFFTQVLEVLCMRLGFMVLQSSLQQQQQQQQSGATHVVALLDLLSYTGYKYLGLSVNMFLGLVAKHFDLGARVYYITFLWTASAASFFMFKTMKHSVTDTTPQYGGDGGGSGKTNRQILVLAFAASQFATMWFVSQTKNL